MIKKRGHALFSVRVPFFEPSFVILSEAKDLLRDGTTRRLGHPIVD